MLGLFVHRAIWTNLHSPATVTAVVELRDQLHVRVGDGSTRPVMATAPRSCG